MYNSPLTSDRQKRNRNRYLSLEQSYRRQDRRDSLRNRRINDETSWLWLVLESLVFLALGAFVAIVLFVGLLL
jgi:hypothetical protein